jgi:hypothetical protein
MIKKQKLPKWFNGELYKKGDTVQNRFSGAEYKLNAMELSMYDFVIGSTIMCEMGMKDVVPDLRRGLDWFRTHNSDAYMVLLD